MASAETQPSLGEAIVYGRTQERDEIVSFLLLLAKEMTSDAQKLRWWQGASRTRATAQIAAIRAIAKVVGMRHRRQNL